MMSHCKNGDRYLGYSIIFKYYFLLRLRFESTIPRLIQVTDTLYIDMQQPGMVCTVLIQKHFHQFLKTNRNFFDHPK